MQVDINSSSHHQRSGLRWGLDLASLRVPASTANNQLRTYWGCWGLVDLSAGRCCKTKGNVSVYVITGCQQVGLGPLLVD